ncbi:MAG: hypothetical protein ABI434_10740 [Burkholderiaceae bacterium]
MNPLIIDTLADTWAALHDLRTRVVSWQWFEAQSQLALEQAAARHALSVRVDTNVLCRAFFDWVHAVDMNEGFESRNPLDFRHAMAGLLLQQLFAAHYAIRARPLLQSTQTDGQAEAAQDGPALLLTSVVLTLLQALRQHAGAEALALDPGLPDYWNSYVENAAQDPATAICFLDRLTGLEPIWQAPTAVGARPAMQQAAVTASS